MSAPAYVCLGCGSLVDTARDEIAARDELIEQQRELIAALQEELSAKLAKIKRQRKHQDAALLEDPVFDEAMGALGHWKAVLHPNARELGGKRLENAMARIHGGYTRENLERAVDGYALKPYVVTTNGTPRRWHEGPKDAWQADAELIFRDAKHVDQGIRIADQADELRKVLEEEPPPEPGPLSKLGRAALRAVSAGWMVFPCRARDKAPATAHGLLNATRNEDVIRRCWARYPDLNVGVRAGAESGLVVLDVDGDVGADSLHRLENEHGALPRTLSVVTPRGGEHFYFQHPGVEVRNTTGFPGDGLDLRGDGGYVLMPPSVGPNGRAYERDEATLPAPLPGWLLKLLTDRQQREASTLARRDYAGFIRGLPEGARNDGFTRLVGHWLAVNVPPAEVLSLAANVNGACRPPLPAAELERTVKSIVRRHGAR